MTAAQLIDLGAGDTLQDLGRKLIVLSATGPVVHLTLNPQVARGLGRMIEDQVELRARMALHKAACAGALATAQETLAAATRIERGAERFIWLGVALWAVGLLALLPLLSGLPG